MNGRKALRAAARAALAADPEFGTYTLRRSWVYAIEEESLPVYGVMTPDQQIASETKDSDLRSTELVVIVKRAGGEALEDDLDDAADTIEAVIRPALEALGLRHVQPTRIRTEMSGQGMRRVGAITVSFACFQDTDI